MNALVIDDNRQMADSLAQMLNLLGVQTEVAYGARTGIMNLKLAPDVVFLDVNMPGVDGFEVLAFLRRHPGLGETPVIIVTSDDQPETAQRMKKMGARAIIIKPPTIDALEKTLKKNKLI